ncbi:uncharacterized protein BDFB_006552 [Asbolus verrucosus]|uniref:Uncharacterized protein n=1 Tax=Asbolus verrucosus TaxID=1661398 RepID=A0A482W0H2_ASBVE|nr:uncharacterized protein BDFB_006552 [Asbolus verrucosus]
MLLRTSLLLFAFFAYAKTETTVTVVGDRLTGTQYPANIKKLKALQEFVNLVNEHKMNVSLILSSGKNYKKGNLKEVMAMTITFPVNSDTLTETKLTPQNFEPLLKAATKEKLAVRGTNAASNKMGVVTNYPEGLPVNKAFKIFSGIKNGKTGFVFDEENYVAQYTFINPGADGKNQTTKVSYGQVDVEVVGHENVKEKEIEVIKQALVDAWFTYDDEYIPRAIFGELSKKLPDYNWEVVGDVGENSYIDSQNWVQLKILNENYLVYSI